ncbi:MAG TPA: sigma 54-interacting transcriptional regulator [Candidatus Binatia bacterium]|nr:sigma 54-interacting transcriptional regulator [Candidatus Binatia bacterium]
MDKPRLGCIPLCSAHELRRDFRDLLVAARPAASASQAAALWQALPEWGLDLLWCRNSPPESARFLAEAAALDCAARAVLLVARSTIRDVAAELPASDSLGANLRRLLGGEALRAADHLVIPFDDQRRPCVGWVGDWSTAGPLLDRVGRLAGETLPVLVRGETGTGKEMIARGLHVLGRRRDKEFLAINCAELPESILESELFGYARGAFTGANSDRVGLFEAAGEGTVFLDEIGELPLAAQAKLLRVLEDLCVRRIGSSQARALSCRIVAATNRDLPREVERGRFRADLFYRLRGVEVHLRPLRERQADILPLAEMFAARAALRFRTRRIEIGEDARLVLISHTWPGNIRELRQTIDVATLGPSGETLDVHQLAIPPLAENERNTAEPLLTANAVERAHILRALAATAGNKMAAARILGLSRQSLQRRMIRHGISVPAGNEPPRSAEPSGNGAPRSGRATCWKQTP